jgi:hypothetical protein
MSPLEHQANDSADTLEEEGQEQTVSRRRLLKALIATGGAAAASTLLPSKWTKPIVEVGVLPVHAQASVAPTITPTPLPPYAIIGCYAYNAAGGGIIGPTDTIQAYAQILPADSGVQLRRTITLNQAGHPQDGVVDTSTGPTDTSGTFQPADFDLNGLSQPILPGASRLTILWEFVNPADGSNTCLNLVDIV